MYHGVAKQAYGAGLFLTSKVRLHCDLIRMTDLQVEARTFPDLKGQAPLRLVEPKLHGCALEHFS